MSEKHKEILIKANAEVDKGNHEGFLEYCTEDTKWIFVGEQTLEGKDAVRKYMAETYIEPPKVSINNLISEGDFLTAVGEISMIDKAGVTTRYSYCDVWEFRDDKLANLRAFVVAT